MIESINLVDVEQLTLHRHPSGIYEQPTDDAGQARTYGASWHMIMSVADAPPLVVDSYLQTAADPSLGGGGGGSSEASRPSLFACLTSRLLRAIKSRQASLVSAACKTVAVIAEARAWCCTLSGGTVEESEGVTKCMNK